MHFMKDRPSWLAREKFSIAHAVGRASNFFVANDGDA